MSVPPLEWPKPGDRIELIECLPDYARFALTAGARGTVDFIDSLATIHIVWDSGLRLGIVAEAHDTIRPTTA